VKSFPIEGIDAFIVADRLAALCAVDQYPPLIVDFKVGAFALGAALAQSNLVGVASVVPTDHSGRAKPDSSGSAVSNFVIPGI
jgi:hypothetical protein